MSSKPQESLERKVQGALGKKLFFVAASEATDIAPLRAALGAHSSVAMVARPGLCAPVLEAIDAALTRLVRAAPGIEAPAAALIEPDGQTFALRTLYGIGIQATDAKGVKAIGDAGSISAAQAMRLKIAFPKAKVVFLVRDGRDIALNTWESMRRQRPNPRFARAFADHVRAVGHFWRRDWEIVRAFRKRHPDGIHVVKAEDLRDRPEDTLRDILVFLGLGKAKAVLGPCLEAARAAAIPAGPAWWMQFDEDARRAFEGAAGNAIKGFGYTAKPPAKPDAEPVAIRPPASALPPLKPDETAGDDAGREAELRAAASAKKKDSKAQFALGNFLWSRGRIGECLPFVEAALEYDPGNYTAANVMTMALAKLGREKEAIAMGQRALELKDKAAVEFFAANSVFARLSASDVDKPFSEDRKRNVIAFSLWGDLPIYTEGAVANAEIARYLYPSWTCRYYHDETVPKPILERLRARGAETILLPATERGPHGGAWRFFAADDTDIDRYICRDCDSRLSVQERLAVDDWIRSGKAIHIMRDHVWHNELILAGLWGGIQGALPPIAGLIRDGRWFSKSKWYDQFFLWGVVWPLMRERHLTHDAFYRLGNSRPFPEIGRLPSHAHVGGTVVVA